MSSLRVRAAGFVLFLLMVSPGMFAGQPDTTIWRFVHPNAKALVGVQWGRVQQSEVGRWIQQRWIHGQSIPGLEFLKDVQEVLISSPGASAVTSDGEPPLLIAIRGSFDLRRVEQVLVKQGHRRQMFSGVPIYRHPAKQAGEPAFALIDSSTVLVGDVQSLFDTIDRFRFRTLEEGSDGLLGRGHQLAARYDCWAVMSEPGALQNFLFASLAGNALSTESQTLEAGISVQDGLAIDVTLGVRTEQEAHLLDANLNRMLKKSTKDRPRASDLAGLFQKLRISTDHSSVLISLRMNLQETARNLKAIPHESNLAVKTAAPGMEPAPPQPRKMIRIEGLDEGTREVLYQR